MKSKKIILDTNIWISYLISNHFDFLDSFLESGDVELVISEELFSEFMAVIKRPKLKKYFSKKNIEHVIGIIERYAILHDVISNIDKCRDPKDNFLLNLALDSKADFFVTGDNDLLVIRKIGKTKILTVAELSMELKK